MAGSRAGMTGHAVVTGGSGFIGRHLIASLVEDGWSVVSVDRIPPASGDPRVRFVSCDLAVEEPDFVPEPGSVVFHLAAVCKEPGYSHDRYFRDNLRATETVCTWSGRHGLESIVYASTMMVYRAQERRLTEDDLTDPDTAYGSSKLLGEWALREWVAGNTARRVHLLRMGVVFGRGENGNFTRLYRWLRGNRFVYVGRRDTVKSWLYVKDAVGSLRFCLDDPGPVRIYNVVHPRETTIGEICAAFSEVFGFRRWRPVLPYRLLLGLASVARALPLRTGIHPRRIQKLHHSTNLSADRILAAGWKPDFDLEEALRDWKRECGGDDLG